MKCRVCGCTERKACFPPCHWITQKLPSGLAIKTDLCSTCDRAINAVADWYVQTDSPKTLAMIAEARALAQRWRPNAGIDNDTQGALRGRGRSAKLGDM